MLALPEGFGLDPLPRLDAAGGPEGEEQDLSEKRYGLLDDLSMLEALRRLYVK